jgi:hypothetical protein
MLRLFSRRLHFPQHRRWIHAYRELPESNVVVVDRRPRTHSAVAMASLRRKKGVMRRLPEHSMTLMFRAIGKTFKSDRTRSIRIPMSGIRSSLGAPPYLPPEAGPTSGFWARGPKLRAMSLVWVLCFCQIHLHVICIPRIRRIFQIFPKGRSSIRCVVLCFVNLSK